MVVFAHTILPDDIMSRLGITCQSVVFVHAISQENVSGESESTCRAVVFVYAMPPCGDFVIFSLP